MIRRYLHVRAPFAAFRPLEAGAYRTSAPTMPPSAAAGLLLNLACIEVYDEKDARRPSVPPIRVAIGEPRLPLPGSDPPVYPPPRRALLLEQLHAYTVGTSDQQCSGCKKILRGEAACPACGGFSLTQIAKGHKSWITPVQREILVGFEAVVGFEAERDLVLQIEAGVRGKLAHARRDVPFLGDNTCLPTHLSVHPASPLPCRWHSVLLPARRPRSGACDLTVDIDRQRSEFTTTLHLAPTTERSPEPPEAVWIWVPRAPGVPARWNRAAADRQKRRAS